MEGDVAIVMASSSGLGLGSAIALAREGVNVVINGRDLERLESAVESIREIATGEVRYFQGDIKDPMTASKMVKFAVGEFGKLDHLVTNSGPPPCLHFEEAEDADWYESYELLVMSVVRMVREAEPYLRESENGTIVTITSRIVKEPTSTNVLSSAIRMAIIGLGKTLTWEFAPDIRVNSVLPGKFDTPRLVDDPRDLARKIPNDKVNVDGIPIGRIGDPMELGEVVAFLCSKNSSFINGVALQVDGGSIKAAF
jgi:3-oxoacyl-[acyl-carrier protein] reductase|tara:strand:+ start:21363 stop:22124 length:762 start_codon:yes stop_codon:yes gene_type:complete